MKVPVREVEFNMPFIWHGRLYWTVRRVPYGVECVSMECDTTEFVGACAHVTTTKECLRK